MAKDSRKERGEQQERIKKKYGAGSPEHKAAIERTKASVKKTSTKKSTKKTTGGNIKDAPSDTAARRSPTTYKPKVPIAKKGSKKVFHGTNIPTTGYTPTEIRDYNARLKADIDAGDSRGANDVIFSIAFQKGGGEGNPRVGAVQSGMYKLNKGNLWAEDNINSTNDRYVIRDASGKPTGDEVRFSDQHGVVKGKANEWKSTGSWGENARAGILEGRPTTTAPPSGILASIVDLDDPNRTVLAGPGAGKPYTGDVRVDTGDDTDTGRVRTRPTGGRGEYLATKYDRPGLLDWSDLAPPEMPGTLGTAQAQQSLLDRGLAAYQPWRRPGVGEAFEYQPATAPTYATRASLLGSSPAEAAAEAAAAKAAAAAASSSSSSSSGDGYTGPLGKQWDSYQDWYMADRPDISGVTTGAGISPLGGHQAALNRLYNAAGGDAVWGNLGVWQPSTGSGRSLLEPFGSGQQPYTGYDAWLRGPRGDTGMISGEDEAIALAKGARSPSGYYGGTGGFIPTYDRVISDAIDSGLIAKK